MLIAFIQAFTLQTAQMHLKMTLRYFRYLAVWMHKQVARDKLKHDLTSPLGQRSFSTDGKMTRSLARWLEMIGKFLAVLYTQELFISHH